MLHDAIRIAFPVLACGIITGACSKKDDHLNLDEAPVLVDIASKDGCEGRGMSIFYPDKTNWRLPPQDSCENGLCYVDAREGDFLFRAEFVGKPGDPSAPVGHYHMRIMDVDSRGVAIEHEKELYGCIYTHSEFRVNFDGTGTPGVSADIRVERTPDPGSARITLPMFWQ